MQAFSCDVRCITRGLMVTLLFLCATAARSETLRDAQIERVISNLVPNFVTTETEGMRLDDRLAHYNVPGVSIAVIDEGNIAWARGFGLRDVSTKASVEAITLFQAASISKPVAAVAALKLVEQRKLNLDQDVNEKLTRWRVPESPFTATEKVTLRRLLSHSAGLTVSGFPGYVAGTPIPTAKQILEGTAPANTPAVKAFYPPKSKVEYSGGGFTVVQQLLMDVSGASFEKLLEDELLKPLNMRESAFSQPLASALEARAASGHNAKAEVIAGRYRTHPELAAAGLWTTPADLARFAIDVQRAIAGQPNTLLSPAMAREMLSVQAWPYGLGFVLEGEDESARFSHRGSNAGFQCILIGFKARGAGVVIMSNGDNANGLIQEIVRAVATEYQWPALAPTRYAVKTLPPETLRAYEGFYVDANNQALRVRLHEGALLGQSGGGWSPLAALGDDAFAFVEQQTELRFTRDGQGRVQRVATKNEAKTQSGLTRASEPPPPFDRVPFFVRGSMNDWSNANPMKEIAPQVFSARVPLKAGFNEFKIASEDYKAIDLGTLPIGQPAKPGQTLALVAVGRNIPLMIAEPGTYEFSVRTHVERGPEISVQKIE
jgi:CubicO group peptidase (beta-lactamase class C family)